MKIIGAAFVAAALLGAAVPSSGAAAPQAAPGAGFVWPVPAGWRCETIPFPLDFAPGLPHRGVEELRFLPGFARPHAPDYWSYDFVWRLNDGSALNESSLSAELASYFRGLDAAVDGGRHRFDPARFKAAVSAVREPGTTDYRARVDAYDPFATGRPIVLNVEIRRVACPGTSRRAVAFALSPAAYGAPVWNALRLESRAFRCL